MQYASGGRGGMVSVPSAMVPATWVPSGVSGGIEIVTPKMTQPAASMIVMIMVAGGTPGRAVPW